MATKEATVGMDHPTAVPENFEPESELGSCKERDDDAPSGRGHGARERSDC